MSYLEIIPDQSICKIEVTTWDNTNKPLTIFGTAFCIKHNGNIVLVTNRHNFDPYMKDSKYKGYKVIKICVFIREKKGDAFTSITKLFEVDLAKSNGFIHNTADVAILFNPSFKLNLGVYTFTAIEYSNLAKESFFKNSTQLLDPIAFIGFPQDWYDTDWNSPIARIANLSSNPKRNFHNKQIKSSDVILVAGLSFGGGSGSPVVFLEKGNSNFFGTGFPHILPQIIGIMSGHFFYKEGDGPIVKDREKVSSGLSYFTRSTSIIEVLTQKNSESIESYIAMPEVIHNYEILPKSLQ